MCLYFFKKYIFSYEKYEKKNLWYDLVNKVYIEIVFFLNRRFLCWLIFNYGKVICYNLKFNKYVWVGMR